MPQLTSPPVLPRPDRRPARPVSLRRFAAADFATYRAWFGDAELDRRLGPIDDAWLDHVLAERDGRQYVALDAGRIVAVVGVLLPQPADPWGALTDLAVAPARRGTGIGRRVVAALLARPELAAVAEWRAWVEGDNAAALALLDACGWTRAGVDDGMVEFRLRRATRGH